MIEWNMSASRPVHSETVKMGEAPSGLAKAGLESLQDAVAEALDRKRRLGQYHVEWDGEKPVKVYPENSTDAAAE